MKNSILFAFSALIFLLAACGEDENAAQNASIKTEVLSEQKQWESFKTSINGDYQMTYEESGFVLSNGEQTSTVENGTLLIPPRVQCEQGTSTAACEALQPKSGTLTMDRLYENILALFDNDHCEIDSIVFEDSRPLVKEYTALCGEETYTLTVKSFNPVVE